MWYNHTHAYIAVSPAFAASTIRRRRRIIMNARTWICFASLWLPLAGRTVAAQDKKADDSRPATTNLAGAAYPRIHSDLRLTFQLKAPSAEKVQLSFGVNKDIYDLKRGAGDVWSVTTR